METLNIMAKAWIIVRATGVKIGEALKRAWAEFKNNKVVKMLGSQKQIEWATKLMNEYSRLVDVFGGVKVECNDSKFWIENAQVTNLNYSDVPARLEAYNFIRSSSFIDATQANVKNYITNGLRKEVAMMIYRLEVK